MGHCFWSITCLDIKRILTVKVHKLFSFFVSVYSKRNRKHALRVLSSCTNTPWKFGRTRKSCEDTHPSTRVSRSPKILLVFPTRWKRGACSGQGMNDSGAKHHATLFTLSMGKHSGALQFCAFALKESEVIWKWTEDIKAFECPRALFFTRTFISYSRW